MIAEEGIAWRGRQILLAGRKILRDVSLRPQSVCHRFLRGIPSMKHSSAVTADFASHPAATVVIHSVHYMTGVVGCMYTADHGMPLFGKVAPPATFRKPDEKGSYGALHFGRGRIRPRQQHWDAIEMVYYHFILQDFAVEQPKRKEFREKFGEADSVRHIALCQQEFSRGIIITAVNFLSFVDVFLGDALAHLRDLQLLDYAQGHRQHSLVFTNI